MEIGSNLPEQNEIKQNVSENKPSQEILRFPHKKETKIKKIKKSGEKKKSRKKVNISNAKKKKNVRQKKKEQTSRKKKEEKKRRREKKEAKVERNLRYKLAPTAGSASDAKDHALKPFAALYGKIEKLRNAWMSLEACLMRLCEHSTIEQAPLTTESYPQAPPLETLTTESCPPASAPNILLDENDENHCWARGLGWDDHYDNDALFQL